MSSKAGVAWIAADPGVVAAEQSLKREGLRSEPLEVSVK